MRYILIVVLISCFCASLLNIASRQPDQDKTPRLIPVQELSKREQALVRDYVLTRIETIEIS